jgi:hypothetical protein
MSLASQLAAFQEGGLDFIMKSNRLNGTYHVTGFSIGLKMKV